MRIAVFASGGGSNFQAIADACLDDSLPATVACCIASRPGIGVIDRASRMGIAVHILPSETENWSENVLQLLDSHGIDLIVLAGFMRKLPVSIIDLFRDRILNIHPALLPDFGGKGMYGMNVHKAVIASGAKTSGATVHLVDEDYDTGAIVLQESVPVLKGDSPADLAARVLSVEHSLYPRAIALFARNQVTISGRTVSVLDRRML